MDLYKNKEEKGGMCVLYRMIWLKNLDFYIRPLTKLSVCKKKKTQNTTDQRLSTYMTSNKCRREQPPTNLIKIRKRWRLLQHNVLEHVYND